MSTATRSPLTEQAEKLGNLAGYLSDGRLLEQVLRKAQTGDVWSGPVQQGFLAWLQFAVDGWVRNQLATGVRLVAESLQKRADQINSAAQAMAAGTATTVTVPPPAPLNYTPGRPPPYGDIGGGAQSKFNPDQMTELAKLLEVTADDTVITFGRGLRSALEPPLPPPAAPGAPPAISPLPPDAVAAVGNPDSSSPGSNVFLALADELHRAADDISRRVRALRLVDEPLDTTTLDPNLVSNVSAGATALVSGSETAEERAAAPDPPTALPHDAAAQTPEAQQRGREAADALVADHPPSDKTLDDPERIQELARQLRDHEPKPDPAFSARFVERFGAKGMIAVGRSLQAWQQGWDKFHDRMDNNQRGLRVGKAYDKPTNEEVEDVIYSFSATLATATTSDSLPKKVKDDLINTSDPLALSWLLCDPGANFDPDFLVRAFDKCVRNTIIIDASRKGQPQLDDFRRNPGLVLTGSVLSHDPKIAALEAISRNADAALRLQREFKPFELRYGGGHGSHRVDSLADLLYRGADVGRGYPDDGNSVGRTLTTIYDSLLAQSQRNSQAALDAQHALGQMVKSASTTELPTGCRRSLSVLLSGHMANVAAIIYDPDNQLSAEFRVAEDFTDAEVKRALSEIARDPHALATAMGGLGKLVEATYDELARKMAQQADPSVLDPSLLRDFKQENLKIGETFCEMARSVRAAGIKEREDAMSALASFRFGIDIVFDAVKQVPVVGAIEGGLNTATAGAAGKVTGLGEDALKDKVAGWLSGVDAEEEAAKSKKMTKDNVSALNGILFDRSMTALGKHPMLLHALLTREPASKWPEAMLLQPHPPWPPQPAPPDGGYLRDYLKPEYLTSDGGVQFPLPGDPAYFDYRSWCKQDWNTLAEQAHVMSDEASTRMSNCMAQSGWIDAA